VAGTGTTVTGNGNTATPYVISSTAASSVYVAGAGLGEAPARTFNVGAGPGITVAADTVSADLAFLDTQYGPETLYLNDLIDVDTVTVPVPIPGDALVYNGTMWRPGTVSQVEMIDELLDVDTSTVPPAASDILYWNGTTNWVPGVRVREVFSPTPPAGASHLRWIE
jgi:hypothetical protein